MPHKKTEEGRAEGRAYYAANRDKIRSRARARYAQDGDAKRARGRAYQQTRKEKIHTHWLKKTYGLTPEAFDSMLSGQGGACAICHTKEWGHRGPCVDHDHATGAVRGILCQTCNLVLGLMKDSPVIAESIKNYIQGGER